MALPALSEVAAEAGGLHGEAPLIIGRGPADDRGFGDEATADLPNDAIQGDSGKWAEMLKDIPRPRMSAHLLDHILAEVLPAVFTVICPAANELAAGYAGDSSPVPDALGNRA